MYIKDIYFQFPINYILINYLFNNAFQKIITIFFSFQNIHLIADENTLLGKSIRPYDIYSYLI